ncbi:hypothetical protein [uncultured Brevibacillus sp.]|uniref:hypothetical protein n=1 Tax=uncultured Brevibacillus sp. TaxID=169970 RepID=UPI00259A4EB5|nr:hypothetical protein [uncultured Brevibacillus sp.]
MEWRKQDWIWLLVFLVYAQAFMYIYQELIMTVISYVSTFVSISLAGVAMFISLKQINQNDSLVGEMHRTLGSMNERLNQVDTKVSNFDPSVIKKDIELDANKIKEELIHELKNSFDETSTTDIEEVLDKVYSEIDKKIDELNVRIQSSVEERLNIEQKETLNLKPTMSVIREIVFKFGFDPFTAKDVLEKVPRAHYRVVMNTLKKMEEQGTLKSTVIENTKYYLNI